MDFHKKLKEENDLLKNQKDELTNIKDNLKSEWNDNIEYVKFLEDETRNQQVMINFLEKNFEKNELIISF